MKKFSSSFSYSPSFFMLAFVFLFVFINSSACASEFSDLEPVTLIMADGTAKGAVGNLWAELFVKNVAKLTGNKLKIEYHGHSELGGDLEIIQKMKAGLIDCCDMQSMNAASEIKELGVLELPLVFAKYKREEIDKVVKPGSKFFNALNEYFRRAGFELVDYMQGGTYREMSSNKPVKTLEDFKGIKIRTLTSEYQVSFWENLGCITKSIPFENLYEALKDGVVEAEENAIDTQVNSSFYNVQKYLILTHHNLYGNLFYMTKAKFDELAPAYQKAIRNAAVLTSSRLQRRLKEISDNALATMLAGRVEVIELSDEVIDEIIKATEPTSKLIRKNIGDEICDLLINSLAEASSD